jgi:hypothetical protein
MSENKQVSAFLVSLISSSFKLIFRFTIGFRINEMVRYVDGRGIKFICRPKISFNCKILPKKPFESL